MKPLCIDLFCGLGGWADGFLAGRYDVIGFDIERHDYGTGGYPGQLVIQDVRTLDGINFKDAVVIVASPPCQNYSYMAMPWSRAKAMAVEIRESWAKWYDLNELFVQPFRIAAQAGVPLIVENVRGAQPWVGRSRWHYGSFHLWGDVPALMPMTFRGIKAPGMNWSDQTKRGQDFTRCAAAGGYEFRQSLTHGAEEASGETISPLLPEESRPRVSVGPRAQFDSAAADGYKLPGNNAPRRWEDREVQRLADATKNGGDGSWFGDYQAQKARDDSRKQGGERWHDPQSMSRRFSSKSNSRKAASAQIAKIPFLLARHIAKCFKPY